MNILLSLSITSAWAILAATQPGCNKLDVPKDTPACIKKEIKKIQSENVWSPPASVWQYEYNGQTVYYISAHAGDIPSELYDNNCNHICSPDGGFTGEGDGKCSDFISKRTNPKLIWQDERK